MKVIKSFRYALTGIKHGLEEYNMRFHIVAAVTVIVLGMIFSISFIEWSVLLLAIGLVIVTELVNTALEELCDALAAAHKDSYERLGKPKDIAAGAVFVAALVAVAIGVFVFLPYIF